MEMNVKFATPEETIELTNTFQGKKAIFISEDPKEQGENRSIEFYKLYYFPGLWKRLNKTLNLFYFDNVHINFQDFHEMLESSSYKGSKIWSTRIIDMKIINMFIDYLELVWNNQLLLNKQKMNCGNCVTRFGDHAIQYILPGAEKIIDDYFPDSRLRNYTKKTQDYLLFSFYLSCYFFNEKPNL